MILAQLISISLPFAFRHIGKTLKTTLQPNFAKEPSSPSHANAWMKDSAAKMKDKLTGKINNETLTHGIVHAGFSGFRAFVARKKSRCKLIGNRFVIPHDTIP